VHILSTYLPFMLFAFVASITPGPTNILILTSSQRYGVKATLPAVMSACVAASLIVFISGAGAGEILRNYPLVREGMSWAGALWLSWMSWQLFTATAARLDGSIGEPFSGKSAAMLQLINPKTWMMALAIVSLFAPTSAHPLRDVSLLSLSFLLISLLCLYAWTLLGKAVNRVFRTASSLVFFQRVMALCLMCSAWMGFIG
jgi:threonine/homoserine/homoserine lactone efflux protein